MDLLFKLQVFVVEALKAVTHSARGTLFVHAPFNMTDFLSTSRKKIKANILYILDSAGLEQPEVGPGVKLLNLDLQE